MLLNFPVDWKKAVSNFLLKTNYSTYKLDSLNSTWKDIEKILKTTLPQGQIVDIEVVQNIHLWEKYQNECKFLIQKLKKSPKKMLLWHGTGTTDPRTIM